MLILICHLRIHEYVCLLQGLRFPNAINYSLFVPQKLQIKVNKCKTITITNFSTPDFSTMNFWTMGLKSSWLKSPGLKCHLSRRLKDISTLDFSTPDFTTINFSTPWFKNSWLKSVGFKLGDKKSGVEMSLNHKNPIYNFWFFFHINVFLSDQSTFSAKKKFF